MRWYFLFFLVSGFCSLVYEIVWLRLAMAQFGVTTPLVSIVLSTYMAGLGLGCAGAGGLLRRFERESAAAPLRLYALTELLIGVAGLAVRPELVVGHNLLQRVAADTNLGSVGHYAGTGLWIALTLLPWCAWSASRPSRSAGPWPARRSPPRHWRWGHNRRWSCRRTGTRPV